MKKNPTTYEKWELATKFVPFAAALLALMSVLITLCAKGKASPPSPPSQFTFVVISLQDENVFLPQFRGERKIWFIFVDKVHISR
jgi:hypothetical protein